MKTITPAEAATLLKNDSNVVFVDVRSRAEYRAGHPQGAANIPIMEPDPSGRMAPNPHFLEVFRAFAPRKDQPILLSCQVGGRSGRACELLEREGYEHVYNMDGGYGGRRDSLGQMVLPGWESTGLPVDYSDGGDLSYDRIKGIG
jgi:rhodanese-related sulfurtransferase